MCGNAFAAQDARNLLEHHSQCVDSRWWQPTCALVLVLSRLCTWASPASSPPTCDHRMRMALGPLRLFSSDSASAQNHVKELQVVCLHYLCQAACRCDPICSESFKLVLHA